MLLDTSVLPLNVLSYYDDEFFHMVEKVAGFAEAKLLEFQGIRSVYSFLNTEDVFGILSIPCSALNYIKSIICLEADDNTFIVKPGYRSSVQYLHQLLLQKHEEHMKEITLKLKRNKQNNIRNNTNKTANGHQDPLQTVSLLENNDRSLETSGLTNESDSQRNLIIHVLNEWYDKNFRNIDNPASALIENEDYQVFVASNDPYDLAYITCSCKTKVQLPLVRGNICLSNYYKHLRSKSCSMIRKKTLTNNNCNNNSSITTADETLDDEGSVEVSDKERTPYTSSNVLTVTSRNTAESVKRSSSQRNKTVFKRRRL